MHRARTAINLLTPAAGQQNFGSWLIRTQNSKVSMDNFLIYSCNNHDSNRENLLLLDENTDYGILKTWLLSLHLSFDLTCPIQNFIFKSNYLAYLME